MDISYQVQILDVEDLMGASLTQEGKICSHI